MRMYLLPEEKLYRLKLHDTGEVIILDKEDWENLCDVRVRRKDLRWERVPEAPKNDYRRRWWV